MLHVMCTAITDSRLVSHALQATSSKLQRNEMSVDAAQLELDNLKGHAREQESVIDSLQEQLQANQALLGTISRAANQHAKPAGQFATRCLRACSPSSLLADLLLYSVAVVSAPCMLKRQVLLGMIIDVYIGAAAETPGACVLQGRPQLPRRALLAAGKPQRARGALYMRVSQCQSAHTR